MIILFECIDCRYCKLDDDFLPTCINTNFTPDKTREFLPIGGDDAERCDKFSERLISFDKVSIQRMRYKLNDHKLLDPSAGTSGRAPKPALVDIGGRFAI